MELIRSKALSFKYPLGAEGSGIETPKRALDGLDLGIEKGSFVVIAGRNGSGKSTLARLLNCLVSPSEGELCVAGLDARNPANLWPIRRRIGMVFQNPDNQIIGSVVEEDIAFGPENLGMSPELIREKVRESLAAVSMADLAHASTHSLSGGQKQRVSIAGVLAMDSECIVLDEPTAMIDPQGRKDVLKTLFELNKRKGITVILITHNMDEAIGADRLVVMDRGRVVLDGPPRSVFGRVDELRELGLALPQAAELAYELRQAGLDLREDIVDVDELLEGLCRLS